MTSAVKRLAKELQEIQSHEDDCIQAVPLKDDMFEWHFTLQGPADSDYSEGRYHGRINFPVDYPFSPPSISFLTPNGRWEIEKKVCLSVTGFHPEMWQPAWGIRTILLALRDHFTTEDKAAIGYLAYSSESRLRLAKKSTTWKCRACGYNSLCSDSSLSKSDESVNEDSREKKSVNKETREKNEPQNMNMRKSAGNDTHLMITGFILLCLALILSYIYLQLQT